MKVSKEPAYIDTPIGRAIRAIELTAMEKRQPYELSRLAEAMNLPIAAVRRIVRSLVELGLIEEVDENSYVFGARLMSLTSLVQSNLPFEQFARPIMQELVARFDETSTLNAYLHHEGKSICVAVEECKKPIQYVLEPGERKHLHSGAAGKAILAFLPEDLALRIIDHHGLPTVTRDTTTSRKSLLLELEEIRKAGVALTRGERIEGAVGVAAPVFAGTGRVVASVGLTMPAARCSESVIKNAREEVRAQAHRLSLLLGYLPAGNETERQRKGAQAK